MAQYIIINAYKGGVLKTTITSNLGSILALNNKKILLVGLDAQDDLRISFNISENKTEKNLYDLLVEDVDISECIYKYNDNIDLILSDERMENYEFDVLKKKKKKEDYMTALDMFGCSVTLLKLDSELESLLKDKCDTVAMKRRG